ncbi:MAG: peptide chain release factor N(5)-glutamine methyltransferase [Ignavibacteriales bacterium]|nr:peptide chain release factor N(5)-glutamine methyltransferase [Ignavibacteriales bacterium]
MKGDPQREWTIRELMKLAISHLQTKGIDEARLNVELLLAHTLNIARINLYTQFERILTDDEVKAFRSVVERRLKREPVQYIIGSANFMGIPLFVNQHVLIPRPETETLVEQVMLICRDLQSNKEIRLLDIGTGSGNIPVAVAKFVKNASCVSVESDRRCIELAEENVRRYGLGDQIRLLQCDVFADDWTKGMRGFDILVSNPPYVSVDEWEFLQPEVRLFEPKSAVTDGDDGLRFYRRLASLGRKLLVSSGIILLEVGFGQAQAVMNLLTASGYFDVKVQSDLQGIPRVVAGAVTASDFSLN